ncbi:MAG: hypothetical protein ABI629_25980 [bacterium]
MRLPGGSLTAQQRTRFALGLLLLVAAGNAHLIVAELMRLWDPGDDLTWEVQPYIERLAELRRQLPLDAHVLYHPEGGVLEGDGRRELFLVRYALAPRCVTGSGAAPLVLVHGAPGDDLRGMTPVIDVGGGFRLYAEKAAP